MKIIIVDRPIKQLTGNLGRETHRTNTLECFWITIGKDIGLRVAENFKCHSTVVVLKRWYVIVSYCQFCFSVDLISARLYKNNGVLWYERWLFNEGLKIVHKWYFLPIIINGRWLCYIVWHLSKNAYRIIYFVVDIFNLLRRKSWVI